ncbi:ATP/GTP-binding protein [Persicitalea sp.]|uniref:AAA family ATPase n=1 Tax=Persicitalea sp. TaxID=3100273 RepID=UPI003593649B
MLVQFRLRNFMSFRDEQVFSMVAANGLREKNDALNENVAEEGSFSLVKSAVVYGANASGKSNLLRAIAFFVSSLTETPPDGKAVGEYKPFLLDRQSADEPTLLEAVFVLGEKHYRYGFEVIDQMVQAEWLYIGGKKESTVFYRQGKELRIGRSYTKLKELQSKEMINDASLLVNLGALFNDESCLEAKHWALKFRELSPKLPLAIKYIVEKQRYIFEPRNKSRVLHLLQVADLGIDEIIFRKRVSPSPIPTYQNHHMDVFTIRRVWDESSKSFQKVTMPLQEFESEGTQKLFNLIGIVLTTLDEGGIFIADELDAKLHPLLTQRIVQMFNSPATNPKNAQIIFATHDTNLLSAGLFRRDQIWFTEKDHKGTTQLYALTDYKPSGKTVRNDEQLEKNYIAGKYGGIPFLGDFDALFETKSAVSEASVDE